MAISDTYSPDRTLGNGVTTVFTGDWSPLVASYFKVALEDVTSGVQTPVSSSNYTLTFTSTGYSVTMATAPTSSNYLVRYREVPIDQSTPFSTSSGYQGKVTENSFDKLTAIAQDLADDIIRTPKFQIGSPTADVIFPEPAANKFIGWDSTGTILENLDSTGEVGPTGAAGAGIYNGGTAGGTANALTATPSPVLAAYTNLNTSILALIIASDNTSGTVTLNVSALGANNVKKFIGASKVDLAVGDLQAGQISLFSRDGTDIILLNPRTYAKGATVASAGTLDLNTTTGDYVQVSGTTTVTAITLEEGREVTVKFDGILTLTHSASLINLSGANITTAAGDIAVFRGEASSVVRMVNYARASGASLVTSAGAFITFDPTQYMIGYMGKEPTRTALTSNFSLQNSIGCGGSASGAGASASNNSTEWLSLLTGTTSTGYAMINASVYTVVAGNTQVIALDTSKGAKYCCYVEPDGALSDGTNTYVVQFGFGYSGDTDIISGVNNGGNAFRYTHSEAGGDWQCVTRDGTTSTITDTGIPYVEDAAVLLEISINAGFTSVEFKINGSVVATHTTNIYSTQRTLFAALAGIIKKAGTSSRQVYIANYSYQIPIQRIT